MDGSAGERIARKGRGQIARIRGAGRVVHQVLEAVTENGPEILTLPEGVLLDP